MGKVYKALDTEINEKVAIKLVRPDIASDKHAIERFRNELKFARGILHKNVCQMYDLNRDEETHYITMEFISGENLKSFIRKSRQLSVGTALRVAKHRSTCNEPKECCARSNLDRLVVLVGQNCDS